MTYNPLIFTETLFQDAQRSVSAFIASTDGPKGAGAVWTAGPFRYTEVSSGGQLVTAGGVRVNPLPIIPGVWHAGAWGGNLASYATTLQAIITYVTASGNGQVLFGDGTHVISSAATSTGFNDAGLGTPIVGLHLLGIPGKTIFKGNGTNADFIKLKNVVDCSIRGIGFDYNGAVESSFTTCITVNTAKRFDATDNTFFDSNPEMLSYVVGTGDGVETEFFFTKSEFLDRHMMPGTVTITTQDGQTLTDANHLDGTLSGDGTGKILYGSNNGEWVVKMTFDSPPASGDITLSAGHCDQRQSIVVIDCSDVTIADNKLTNGGRIKIGRPGQHCVVERNWLYGVNDNAISTVVIAGDEDTIGVTVRNNTILHPATIGIFTGRDGESEDVGQQKNLNFRCEGNYVLAPRTCFRYIVPANNGPTIIRGNFFHTNSVLHNGVVTFAPSSDDAANLDLKGDVTDAVISDNFIDASNLCAVTVSKWDNVSFLGNTLGTLNFNRPAFRHTTGEANNLRITNNTMYCGAAVVGVNGATYVDCDFSNNTIYSCNDNSNVGIFDFATAPSNYDIQRNRLRMTAGTANQPFVRTSAANSHVRVIGNDWSTSSRITGVVAAGSGSYTASSVTTPNYGTQPS